MNDTLNSDLKEKKPPIRSGADVLKKNKWLSLILFSFGTACVFLGYLLIVLSNATKYLLKNLDEETRDLIFLAAISLGFILFAIGFILNIFLTVKKLPKNQLISTFLDNYYKEQSKPERSTLIFSFALSRLIAGILLVIMGFIDLFILTAAIGHHNSPYGQTIVLGGPSAFYPVALFPAIFGLGLILFTLGSSHKLSVAQTKDALYFHEFRPHQNVSTEILKNNIEAFRYQNNQFGPKFIWLILFIPMIVLTLVNGTFYLFAPLLTDPTQGILFYYTAITESIVLFLLVMRPQQYFEIATKNDLYEYWLEPFSKDLKKIPRLSEEIADMLECNPNDPNALDFIKNNKILTPSKDYIRILIGVFFIGTAIPMICFQILFGQFYYWFALFFGSMCLIRGISNDFDSILLAEIESNTGIFKFKRASTIKFCKKFYYYRTFEKTDTGIVRQFRKLDFFDVTILPAMILFMTIELCQGWFLSNDRPLILLNLDSTIFMIIVVTIVLTYLCLPINQIKVTTPTINYYIPVKIKCEKMVDFKSAISKPLKNTFLLRLLIIMLTILGSIIGTIVYLSTI